MRFSVKQYFSLFTFPIFTALILSGCSSPYKYEQRGTAQKQALEPLKTQSQGLCKNPYMVKAGDTLSEIAAECDVDMQQIAKLNDLLPPYIIYVKQELDLPVSQVFTTTTNNRLIKPTTSLDKSTNKNLSESKRSVDLNEPKLAKTIPSSTTSTKTEKSTVQSTSNTQPQITAVQPSAVPNKNNTSVRAIEENDPIVLKDSTWQWPMHKGIDYRFKRDKAGLSVLEIYGIPGQKVKSVAPGKVVYAGNGIANYGWMLVVKHAKDYMSIYAHNSALLVEEGDYVEAGDVIASLGATGTTDRPKLYLEARYQGRKIDIKKKLKP